MQQGAGKIDRLRVAFACQPVDLDAAGIGEPEELGHLVEGLACGVVYRPTERRIATSYNFV